MDSAEKLSDGVQKTLDNQYLFWSLMLFAIVFGWLARPPLPTWLLAWFENPIFQYFVLFALVYTGSKDLKAAFWSPLIFMAIMYLLSFTEDRYIRRRTGREGFEDTDDADAVDAADDEAEENQDEEDVNVEEDLNGQEDNENVDLEGDIQEDEEEEDVIENEEFENNPNASASTVNKLNNKLTQVKKELETAVKKVNSKVKSQSLNEAFSNAYDFSNYGCGF